MEYTELTGFHINIYIGICDFTMDPVINQNTS